MAWALRRAATSDSASMSLAITEAAPARAAAIEETPEPAAKSITRLPRDQLGIVEQVARDRLAARPAEGPVGRVDVLLLQPRLGRLPDRHVLGGEPQLELGHHGRRFERGVGADEPLGIDRAGAPSAQGEVPATIAASSSQPTRRLDLKLNRQSAGIVRACSKAICQTKCAAMRPARITK